MKKISYIFCLLLLIAACAKTVESETSAWENNKRRVQELKSLYSGFANALDQQMQEAQRAWDASSSISDEEKKIEKMAEANGLIGSGWVGELGGIDDKKRKLRDESSKLSTQAQDANDRMAAQSASSNANMAIMRVESDLRMGATDAVGARAVLRRATDDLAAVQRSVDQVETNIKNKQNAQKKADEDLKKAEETEQASATWTCGYCGKVNDKAANECGGCGAQKK